MHLHCRFQNSRAFSTFSAQSLAQCALSLRLSGLVAGVRRSAAKRQRPTRRTGFALTIKTSFAASSGCLLRRAGSDPRDFLARGVVPIDRDALLLRGRSRFSVESASVIIDFPAFLNFSPTGENGLAQAAASRAATGRGNERGPHSRRLPKPQGLSRPRVRLACGDGPERRARHFTRPVAGPMGLHPVLIVVETVWTVPTDRSGFVRTRRNLNWKGGSN